MLAPGKRDAAAARRRNFALIAAGGQGLVLVLAVVVGPQSSGHPAAHGAASPSVTARATAGVGTSQHTAAAKLAAEADRSGNPVADASAADALKPQPSWNAKPKVVRYHGYQFHVPGSWPVYNLAAHPSQCVLFDTHAVYLGTPGNVQSCPAHALGRTEALLIQPARPASVPASAVVLTGGGAALPIRTALPAAVADSHMIQIEVPRTDVLVTATYGPNEPRLRAILAGATIAGQGPAPASSSGTATVAASPATGVSSSVTQSDLSVTMGSHTSTATSVQTSKLTAMIGSGQGLDTCTAPSVATMTSWLASPYRVIGTYLGGMNWACSYGNFSATWLRRVGAEGWRFVPLWVGRQAPCPAAQGLAVIDPSHAESQGQAEARSAVAKARAFGFGRGTPIYFDMEGYLATRSCSSAVVKFLGGWTRALHAAGYRSGVYSSARSGIRDLARQYSSRLDPRPDEIWIADWTGEPVLTDPNLPNADWPNHRRLHQFSGSHDEKWGGHTLNIDSDAADGLVVGMPTVPNLPRPAESALPSELRVAPGATARVQLILHGVPRTSVHLRWLVGVPRGLAATPSFGSVDLWPGATYSVTVTLAPAKSLAQGRYDVPIAVTSGDHAITEAFVLVSVVRSGNWLPTRYPVVLYAADAANMAIAARLGHDLALPPADVIGRFSTAWKDTASNDDVVIAVGQPAANALYFNVCGWANPAGLRGGYTPFWYPGYPLRRPPARDFFELASTHTSAGNALLALQLTQYALKGTLPNYGSEPVAPVPPTLRCEGSANVRVP